MMRNQGTGLLSARRVRVAAGMAVFVLLSLLGAGSVRAAGPNLLTNGDFETGTTSGWSAVSAALSVASDAHSGSWAARAANNGASSFGLRTTSKPVTGGTAGAQYTANGFVRSDTPGKKVCIILTEYTSANKQVGQTRACKTTTTSWAALATVSRTLTASGNSLAMAVRETSAAASDSFETDDLSLVQESFSQTQVALWHMNETSGQMIDSGAAPANSGTLSSTGVTRGAAGVSGTGYSFTKGMVTVPDEASLSPGTANVTITLSASPTSLPTSGDFDMIRKGDSPSQMYKMEVLQSGALLCGFRGSASSSSVTSTATIAPNSGYHTLTCRKTTNQISATIDGSTTTKSINIGAISNTAPVVIGAHTGNFDFYKGLMDEVSLTFG